MSALPFRAVSFARPATLMNAESFAITPPPFPPARQPPSIHNRSPHLDVMPQLRLLAATSNNP